MKTHNLGLIAFLSILFLSVSILPYQSRPKLENVLLSTTSDQVITKNIHVPVIADSDDDYWNFDGSWIHNINSNEVNVRNYLSVGQDYGQFRWSLPIPRYSTIHRAVFYGLKNSGSYSEAIIRRINEINVGPLESDISKPDVVDIHSSTVYFLSSGWLNSTITEMIQDQVNLPDWISGYYFGIQLEMAYEAYLHNSFFDYQNSASTAAYLNITYSENVGWLEGWNYRKQAVLKADAFAGANYSIPITVYSDGGTDYSNPLSVYTDGFAQSDFGDIRFTSSDGVTQLQYWLQSTSNEDPTDFFTDDSVDLAFYISNYPSAYYYNNRTYVVFQGDLSDSHNLDAHITYYDHENDTWSGIYYVGQNYCPLKEEQDNHGAPALWVDNQGYIHVVYGSHNQPLRHTKSDFPEDITSWTHQRYITNSRATYPHINYDSEKDHVYIIYRLGTVPGGWVYRNSTDNGQTWSDEQIIIYRENGDWTVYVGVVELDPNNKQFYHFAWERHNASGHDENVYYAYFNVTTGLIYNVSGYNLGYSITAHELPDCLVFDSPDPSISEIYAPCVHVDSNSYPYITYTQYGSGSWTSFQYWNGFDWSESEDISSTTWISSMAMDFIIHSSDNITAFFTKDLDLARYTWDGKDWTFREKIGFHKERIIISSMVPKNYNDELEVIFTEYGEEMKFKRFSYAWGVNGLVKRDVSTQAKFWVLLNENLAIENRIIYIYFNSSDVLTSSVIIHTNTTVTAYWGRLEESKIIHEVTTGHNDSLDNIGINTTISNSQTVHTEFITINDDINDFLWFSTMILNNLFFLGILIFKQRKNTTNYKAISKNPNIEEIFVENK